MIMKKLLRVYSESRIFPDDLNLLIKADSRYIMDMGTL